MKRSVQRLGAWIICCVLLFAALPGQAVKAYTNGWVERDGVRYYLDNGHRLYGWHFIDGRAQFFNENGAMASVWGIDVSEFQAYINWGKVREAGCQFVIIRAGYRGGSTGKLFTDDYFEVNMKGAAAAGIPIGVYFYTQAINVAEAIEEANYVAKLIAPYQVKYPVYIDVEDLEGGGRVLRANLSRRQYTDVALAFCRRIKELGYTPGVYSYESLLNTKLYAEDFGKNGYDVWYAYYQSNLGDYKNGFTMWQYSGASWGTIDGIAGAVDMDVTLVDYAGRYPTMSTWGSKKPLDGENTTDSEVYNRTGIASGYNDPVISVVGEISTYPTLTRGDSGAYVGRLQSWLAELGYEFGGLDEYFGIQTKEAVMQFQKDHKLTESGIVDKITWAALAAVVPSYQEELREREASESGNAGTGESGQVQIPDVSRFPQLSKGSKSTDAVKTLQTWLNTVGYSVGPVDGDFGNQTYNAVRQFQTAKNLTADGVVGQQTWRALAEAYAYATAPAGTGNGENSGSNEEPVVTEDPIKITSQPSDLTAPVGASGFFSVKATGTGLTYRWQSSQDNGATWSNLSVSTGYNTDTVSFTVLQSFNGRLYRCMIKDSKGNTVYSNAVKMTVGTPAGTESTIKITSQPSDLTAPVGASGSFSVKATGTGLTYRWQSSQDNGATWSNLSVSTGYNTDTVSFTVLQSFNGRLYRCMIKDSKGNTVYSNAVKMTVGTASSSGDSGSSSGSGSGSGTSSEAGVPDVSKFPQLSKGSTNTSAVRTLQTWLNAVGYSVGPVDGDFGNQTVNAVKQFQTAKKLTVDGVVGQQTWRALAEAYAKVTQSGSGSSGESGSGSGSDSGSSETTADPIKITSQPSNLTAPIGATGSFSVKATGTGLKYQWQYSDNNGSSWTNLSVSKGYNTDTVQFTVSNLFNGRLYRCMIKDSNGNTVYSSAARMTVGSSSSTTPTTGPRITTQPKSLTAAVGTTGSFSVKATGTGLKYQWQYSTDNGGSWTNLSASTGYNTEKVSFKVTWLYHGRMYRCRVTDANGNTVYSNAVKMTVTSS
ncbi:MAG: peptidoglycan-binding protein [Firmicutes bacterium]|nr:peptidoglycan-binding protein [Bacillota bacterium]